MDFIIDDSFRHYWGKRNTTIRDRFSAELQSAADHEGFANLATFAAAVLRQLPVADKDAAKKHTLIEELSEVERQHKALSRRVEKAARALKRLPVENRDRRQRAETTRSADTTRSAKRPGKLSSENSVAQSIRPDDVTSADGAHGGVATAGPCQ